MSALIRCIRSDCHKFKHTSMLWIHILIPLAAAMLFLSYYSVSPWKPDSKISGYLEAIGVTFPLIIGLICGNVIEQESQTGSFQIMLCGIKSRAAMYISKLLLLILFEILSIVIVVGVFAVGFRTAPAVLYLKAGVILMAGNIFLYILHMFISLRFGRGASIGLGIVESLISALALTGLGDGKWYYIPCTWAARLCDYIIYIWINPANASTGYDEIRKVLMIGIPATCVAFVASIIWFHSWEGREIYD